MSRVFLLAVALVACLTTAGGCGRRDGGAAFLARARQGSRAAEQALARHEPRAAQQGLERLLGDAGWATLAPDDRTRLRQDVQHLLAGAGLAQGRPAEALRLAEQGLALGGPADLFRANLLIDRGRALEALQRDADAAGAYREAQRINEQLLQQLLGPAGGSKEP